MRVLGLGTGGDSGAAVVEDGRILAAVNEERLCRMKMVEGFPRGSIREVLRLSGTAAGELDAVLVAARSEFLVDELQPFGGWFERLEGGGGLGATIKRVAGRFSRFGRRVPLLEKAYYALLQPSFTRRRRAVRRILRREFGLTCPVEFVDHHFSHVTSAYLTSGFDDALVVSLDGGGDGRSGLVYEVRGGEWRRLHEISAFHSLGNYYAYVTHLCGFKAQRHEGKITGLAAHGEPRYVDLLEEFVAESDGTTVNRSGLMFKSAAEALRSRLPADWKQEDLAASIQVHFETAVTRLVRHWQEHTGLRDVALAGGVFANVRVNEEVLRLPATRRVFIHPGMTDGGLPVGAALAACAPGVLEETMRSDPRPLPHVYLGPDLDPEEIEAALGERGLEPESPRGRLEDEVARLLAEGHVVARAAGRMEYGPRALGNRSILYQTTDPAVNDWLNHNLDRTEFMPFAPAIRAEALDRCFVDGEGAEHAAEFMTITLHCSPWMRERMPGVVHVDGTARPQLVRPETNPSFYRVLEAYEELTGLPGVINTSFNMHEEPIVCSARDCVRAFLEGGIDYLALGSHLIRHPELPTVEGSTAGERRRERVRRRIAKGPSRPSLGTRRVGHDGAGL